MKIWTITTDDGNGTGTAVYTTAESADSFASSWVRASWKGWFSASAACHDDWREALSHLVEQTGYNDSLTLTEHDIAHHPAIAKAVAAYDQMQDAICDSQDAGCNDETVFLMEAGAVLVRAALGLHPHPEQAEAALAPTFADQVEALVEKANEHADEEAIYRAAATRLHHKDGEIEIDDSAAVSLGEDPGAYVQAWVWVSAESAGIHHCDDCGTAYVEGDDSYCGQCADCADKAEGADE